MIIYQFFIFVKLYYIKELFLQLITLLNIISSLEYMLKKFLSTLHFLSENISMGGGKFSIFFLLGMGALKRNINLLKPTPV